MQQGRRVVRAQVFDVEELEPRAGDFVKNARDMRHLAAGKDQAVDEFAARRALRPSVAVGGRDAVVERDPAGRNRRAIVPKYAGRLVMPTCSYMPTETTLSHIA